jgi:hypothetical protein
VTDPIPAVQPPDPFQQPRRWRVYTRPLRTSHDFRMIWWSGLISYLGSITTYVAVPFQIKQLTGSLALADRDLPLSRGLPRCVVGRGTAVRCSCGRVARGVPDLRVDVARAPAGARDRLGGRGVRDRDDLRRARPERVGRVGGTGRVRCRRHGERDLPVHVWNGSIPDDMRGRLAGVELLSYSTGPALGNARAGLVASAIGVRGALASGGSLAAAGAVAVTATMRDFRRYDDRTNPHVLARRAGRSSGEPWQATGHGGI